MSANFDINNIDMNRVVLIDLDDITPDGSDDESKEETDSESLHSECSEVMGSEQPKQLSQTTQMLFGLTQYSQITSSCSVDFDDEILNNEELSQQILTQTQQTLDDINEIIVTDSQNQNTYQILAPMSSCEYCDDSCVNYFADEDIGDRLTQMIGAQHFVNGDNLKTLISQELANLSYNDITKYI